MHACPIPAQKTPRYDNTTPREAQSYLTRLWGRIRAKLHRSELRVYGFRISEPQHDGTPHWHLLLFMEPRHVHAVRAILRDYALKEDGDEPGAQHHRFKTVPIDWSRGSAAGYIAKYVSKNIDGYGLEEDHNGQDAKQTAPRVEAWASTWASVSSSKSAARRLRCGGNCDGLPMPPKVY